LLLELSISNLAIIEFVRLGFAPGLSVLTGETGAGKSIIIDAVMLLLGGRASADMVRTGRDAAYVEGVFALEPALLAGLSALLEVNGLLGDSDELILRREILRSRRSICRINGRTVPLSTLAELGRHLIDIHGQGEHLSLLQSRTHIDLLDRYGGLVARREILGEIVRQLRGARAEMAALRRDQREVARRVDLLSYQIEEIGAAALQPGEDEALLRQRGLLANAEQRLQLAAGIYDALMGGEGRQRAALDRVGEAMEQLADLVKLDGALDQEREMLDSAYYQLEELARTVRAYRDDIEADPEGLATIEDRLELIRNLKRKYGDTIEDVLSFLRRATEELDGISHGEERLERLQVEEGRLFALLATAAGGLSVLRGEAALRLSQQVERQLDELNMAQARFVVHVGRERAPEQSNEGVQVGDEMLRFDATGVDRVEFLIAPNPGEEPQPLARIASGGETSRLMLAMKTVLSAVDAVPTLIFDEIDAGIGGHTGDVVGQKLGRLAREHQVFCVTHLAQIARYAAQHYQVAKQVVEERTYSVVRPLSYDERVDELAVMLGGAATEAHRASARELLDGVPAQSAAGGSSSR
jgi:DNA repair protein RecN (Recombination protein N)